MTILIPLLWKNRPRIKMFLKKKKKPKCYITGSLSISNFGAATSAPHQFKRHSNRQGRSPSPGPDVGAAVCWKMRSAACSPGRTRQSGTTQGPMHQLAYGGPSAIKTERNSPLFSPSLSACSPSWGMLGHLDDWAQRGEPQPTSGQRRRQYG